MRYLLIYYYYELTIELGDFDRSSYNPWDIGLVSQ